jgi:O-antigen/teichoic acid export membrane protein
VTSRLLNTMLRGMTLTSRFALLFCLAKFLSPAELGEYGIVFASISYALFIVGFDFYTFSTRELMGKPKDEWPGLIKNHLAFIGACYVATLPLICAFAYAAGAIPRSMILWFLLLLVLEHLAQEINRFLIAMGRPLLASIILFLRSGAWVFVCVAAMVWIPDHRNLTLVFKAWACGGGLAVALGAVALKPFYGSGSRHAVDFRWIGKGLKVAVPLLIGTLASRVLFTVDRYVERYVGGSELLGAYTFYAGIASALLAVLDASVISITGPQLIGAVRKGDRTAVSGVLREFGAMTVGITGVLILIFVISIKPIIALIGKPIYSEHLSTYFLLLAGSGIFCISMIPHYFLYAHGADRAIVAANLMGCVAFCFLFLLVKDDFAQICVPLALLLAFVLMLIVKWTVAMRYFPSDFVFIQ